MGRPNWTGLWRLRHANVDGDPQEELLVISSWTYTPKIICYDGLTHAEQWQIEAESGLSFLAMEVADADHDGELEIVAATGREHTGASGVYLYVYDATTGGWEWTSPILASGFSYFPLLRVAEVDGDANPELLVGRLGADLRSPGRFVQDLCQRLRVGGRERLVRRQLGAVRATCPPLVTFRRSTPFVLVSGGLDLVTAAAAKHL